MGEDPVVEVVSLSKRFGSVLAVDDLSFTVGAGQVVGLLGPNGAGKTTTLRLLIGLIQADEGHASILGEQIRPGAPVLKRVGSLVEGPGFVPYLSGRRNLELYWRAGGGDLATAHLDEALALSGLGAAAGRKVKTYSHGMRQRLGFAQATLGAPDFLILDEPVNGLDPHQIVEVREALLRLADGGTTILLSSHLLAEVEQTCGFVVVIDQGRLIRAGTVAEITSETDSAYLEVDDPHRAWEVLGALAGIRVKEAVPPNGIIVHLDGATRRELVAALVAAGIGVDTVMARRNLEAAFLSMTGGEEP
jgi:ABC-2 type transport system ATP-binding protein